MLIVEFVIYDMVGKLIAWDFDPKGDNLAPGQQVKTKRVSVDESSLTPSVLG